MSRYERTPSTHVVHVLDMTEASETCAEWINKHREIDGKPPTCYKTSFEGGNQGIVQVGDDYYWICEEGVFSTSPLTDDKDTTKVGFYGRFRTEDGKESFSMMPDGTISLLKSEAIKDIEGAKTVPLHEFIRSFGSRLESNYAMADRFFTNPVETLERYA